MFTFKKKIPTSIHLLIMKNLKWNRMICSLFLHRQSVSPVAILIKSLTFCLPTVAALFELQHLLILM